MALLQKSVAPSSEPKGRVDSVFKKILEATLQIAQNFLKIGH